MSIPRDHHFLPKFYTARWVTSGSLICYTRPRPYGPLHGRAASPKAVGKRRDLYRYTEGFDEIDRQRIEVKLFGPIETRASEALRKIDEGEPGSGSDKIGLVQFVLSLQFRSPSRIDHLLLELKKRFEGIDLKYHEPLEFNEFDRDLVLDLVGDLISSDILIEAIGEMQAFRVDVPSDHKLLTSDHPLIISQGIDHQDAFIILPYAPDRLVIFARRESTVARFSDQDPKLLAYELNDAVVRQARHFVISPDQSSRRFIDNRFLRNTKSLPGDGILRWELP